MFQPGGPSLRELLAQALRSTDAGYELLAPKFDATPFRTPDPILEAMATRWSPAPPNATALDLCCGTGAAAAKLVEAGYAVQGIDRVPGMLQIARTSVPSARFSVGQATDFELAEPVDLIVCFGAFGHITRPEQPAMLRCVARALKPGGRFLFATRHLPAWWERDRLTLEGFNTVMRVRNRLRKPPFVMYYLNFCLHEALPLCREAGLRPEVQPLGGQVRARPDFFCVSAVKPS